jgi:hypothetical protein
MIGIAHSEVSMTRLAALTLAAALLLAPGCSHWRHGGALAGNTDNPQTAGTISGIVQGTSGGDPLAGRRVEAVHAGTGARYSAVTNVSGGFTIQVPPGDYRLQVELREGEVMSKDPGAIHINMSDLDANIVVEVGAR